jgi:putative transposase
VSSLEVAPSGFYEWLKNPLSKLTQEDARLLRLIRASFKASHGTYGAPRAFLDLREAGEICNKHRVTRLMREDGLRALHGYQTRRISIGKPSVMIPRDLIRRTSCAGCRTSVGDAHLAAHLFNRCSELGLLQREGYLLLGELAPLHGTVSLQE